MATLGQASGAWTEGSSSLRLMHVGVKNSVGVLTDDAFTQLNPPVVTTAATVSTSPGYVERRLYRGTLGGSVVFTRPDGGANHIGGPSETISPAYAQFLLRPLGCFINDSIGRPFENTPAAASGKNTYVSAQGTYGNRLFETQILDSAVVNFTAGDAFTYYTGQELIASRNGYLMPRNVLDGTSTWQDNDLQQTAAQSAYAGANDSSITIAILKNPADSTQNEIVYDQRI